MSSLDSKTDHKSDHKGYRAGGLRGKTERTDDQQSNVKEKQPTLRGATITGMHSYRPRAGTFGSRKDTFHSTASKDKQIRPVKDDRQSQGTEDYHVHHVVDYENTYKMEPDLKFQESQVRDIISAVLNENLKEKEYDHSTMNWRITLVCSKILEGVKQLDMKRYKLVSHVLVGENKDSAMQFSSRCLWDKRWDVCTSATIKTGNIYATGLVFGIYAE